MKKLILMFVLLFAINSTASAAFVNGGFEDGDWTGWTQNGGSFNGAYTWTGDPGKSFVVSPGLDAYTGGNLNMVYSGNHSARINNFDYDYHFSTISQSVTGWADDAIYFAWAAVLEEPGNQHPQSDAPHFSLSLVDDTTSTTLYSTAFNVYNAGTTGITWNDGYNDGYNQWKYNNWEVVSLDTSGVVGHDLTIQLLASDCGWGGHGGYAYLDGFGAEIPPQNEVPEPMSMALFGIGLLGTGYLRRKK